jgi:sec-independent protein translocase protein TatB
MFEVGFTEIVLILGLALMVLGPEKLPGLAEKVGRWTGRARAMARQLRTQLEQEVTLEEMAKSRPMQPPPPATAPEPEVATPTAYEQSATPPPDVASVDASAANPVPPVSNEPVLNQEDRPHTANSGLDLQTMVSGMEPPPQSAVETPAPTKAAH